MENTLRPEAVSPLFRGRFGHPYIYRPSCPTTQELVRGLGEGAVAACEQQTAGRGRMGRRWVSPWGAGVLFSIALAPRTPPDRLPPLGARGRRGGVRGDLAGCRRCAGRTTSSSRGRKLAGVLAELREGRLVVGVGVNANLTAGELPADARVPATSLRILRGAPVDRAQLLADLRGGDRGPLPPLRGARVHRASSATSCADARRAGRRRARPLRGGRRAGRLVVDGRAHTSAEVTAVLVAADRAHYTPVDREAECQDGF